MDNERSAIINIGGDEYELLLTTKAAITEALYKGTKRNVVSEADSKNVAVE